VTLFEKEDLFALYHKQAQVGGLSICGVSKRYYQTFLVDFGLACAWHDTFPAQKTRRWKQVELQLRFNRLLKHFQLFVILAKACRVQKEETLLERNCIAQERT
jgi:hypothetical protein